MFVDFPRSTSHNNKKKSGQKANYFLDERASLKYKKKSKKKPGKNVQIAESIALLSSQ